MKGARRRALAAGCAARRANLANLANLALRRRDPPACVGGVGTLRLRQVAERGATEGGKEVEGLLTSSEQLLGWEPGCHRAAAALLLEAAFVRRCLHRSGCTAMGHPFLDLLQHTQRLADHFVRSKRAMKPSLVRRAAEQSQLMHCDRHIREHDGGLPHWVGRGERSQGSDDALEHAYVACHRGGLVALIGAQSARDHLASQEAPCLRC